MLYSDIIHIDLSLELPALKPINSRPEPIILLFPLNTVCFSSMHARFASIIQLHLHNIHNYQRLARALSMALF